MRDAHDFHPSHEVEQSHMNDRLLSAVSRRFEEAGMHEAFRSDFYFITTDSEEDGQAIAVFNLAESHERYRNNEGLVLEVRIPIEDAAHVDSGLLLLAPLNPERFFIVKQNQAGQSRAYKVTEETIIPYRYSSTPRHSMFPYKIPKSYPKKLLSQLEDFVIVPARPRNPITRTDI